MPKGGRIPPLGRGNRLQCAGRGRRYHFPLPAGCEAGEVPKTPTHAIPMTWSHLISLAAAGLVLAAAAGCRHASPLPEPNEFTPARYLGTWYEVARMPAFFQPDETLAVATYEATAKPGRISVLNRSYDRQARPLKSIAGHADLMPGRPHGRFVVKFPGVPSLVAAFSGPNYWVIHVDPEYRRAIVGVPSRKYLWILSREASIPKAELDELVARARAAGFATDKLIVAPWPPGTAL